MGGSESDNGTSIAIDADRNIYTTGYFQSIVDFDPGTGEQNLNAEEDIDVFVQKLSQTTVGVIENSLEDKFVVFPNPTNGNFAIEFDKIQQNLIVRLLAVSGALIENKSFRNTNLIQMKINQPPGIYMLEISDEDGNKAVLKLSKI